MKSRVSLKNYFIFSTYFVLFSTYFLILSSINTYIFKGFLVHELPSPDDDSNRARRHANANRLTKDDVTRSRKFINNIKNNLR